MDLNIVFFLKKNNNHRDIATSSFLFFKLAL